MNSPDHALPSTPTLEALLRFRGGNLLDAVVWHWAVLPEETYAALEDHLDETLGGYWREGVEEDDLVAALLAWADVVDRDPEAWRDAQDFHRSGRTYEQWVGYIDRGRGRELVLAGVADTRPRSRPRGAGRPARRTTSRRPSASSSDPALGDESDSDEPPGGRLR